MKNIINNKIKVEGGNTNEKAIIDQLVGRMLFTNFGNTEYAGYVYYNEQDGLYFMAEREGMKKSISLEEAQQIINDGYSDNFFSN